MLKRNGCCKNRDPIDKRDPRCHYSDMSKQRTPSKKSTQPLIEAETQQINILGKPSVAKALSRMAAKANPVRSRSRFILDHLEALARRAGELPPKPKAGKAAKKAAWGNQIAKDVAKAKAGAGK